MHEPVAQYPLWQLEEELDPAARTRYQVVEVLHFMCGEIIPRWVLCPSYRNPHQPIF